MDMKTLKFIVCIILYVISLKVYTQSISNIKIIKKDKKFTITYDLKAKQPDEKFIVDLFVSEDGGATFRDTIKGLSGDVGKNILPGLGKQMIWDMAAGNDSIKGPKIKFEVRASSMNESEIPRDSVFEFSMDMVLVRGGTFKMGCTDEQGSDCKSDEKPSHNVTLTDFYMGIYEVTQAQWKAVMRNNPSDFNDCDSCPVEQVSWNDVQDFLKKLKEMTDKTYMLPTEAQWEFAARGGASTVLSGTYAFSGSNNIEDIAWFTENAFNIGNTYPNYGTHNVGTKKSNFLDLYDMSGNVGEWCSDLYGNYNRNDQTNPKGPGTGTMHVIRGGAWDSLEADCRVSSRNKLPPDKRTNAVGFRLVYVP